MVNSLPGFFWVLAGGSKTSDSKMSDIDSMDEQALHDLVRLNNSYKLHIISKNINKNISQI